ncbi:unnamed protein product [Prorocentrum cordatum]|uniref:RBR-type E3 ubiquitin transferase n=1 Tax=Prorocentrum cordatum TaxID=2364126 RepID=A0ABN9TNG2_9DINO|nr:unnamed protein product [Polarella glacialis]
MHKRAVTGPGWKWQTCFFVLKSGVGIARRLLWTLHPNDEVPVGSVHLSQIRAVQALDTPDGEACLIVDWGGHDASHALTLRSSSPQTRQDARASAASLAEPGLCSRGRLRKYVSWTDCRACPECEPTEPELSKDKYDGRSWLEQEFDEALAAAATPARAGMRRSSGAPPAETQPRQGRPGSPRRQRAAQASSGSGRKAGASGGGQRRCSSFADRAAAAAAAAPAADASPEEAALEVCTQRVACSICCEEAPLQSAFRLACRHGWYCGGCMQRHAEARLASGSAEVPCPECYAPVAERDLRKLLPPAIVERLLARSLEQAVSAAPDLRACPTPNCPMRVALDEGETGRLHCPMCRKVSCLRCGARPFHRGLTCDEHARRQRLKGNGQDEDSLGSLQKWMDSVGAKKCPSCSMAITKQTLRNQATQYSECHKMKCRNCSTRFCFKCLAVLTDRYLHMRLQHRRAWLH